MLLFVASCNNKIEKIDELGDLEGKPDVEIINMESIYNRNGKMKLKISAPVARNYTTAEEPCTEFPDGLKIIFFDEQFNEVSSLTSDYAIYYINKKLWKASGNVLIKNVQGGTLQTEEIFGDEANERIYSLKYVKVTDADGSIVEGKGGFVSNFGFTSYEFKDVSGIFEEEIDF